MGWTGNEGVVGKARIDAGIRHYQRSLLQDGMRAKGMIARVFLDLDAENGEVELPRPVDEADRCHRNIQQPGGKAGDPVEPLIGRGIEKPKAVKRGKPLTFV